MTAVETPTPVLSATDARRLTARIRDALALADDLLTQAYAGRIWEALGLPDFAAYCAAELPELRHIKLRAPARRARAAKLLAVGATERDIAAGNGSGNGTAHRDVLAARGPVLQMEQTVEEPAGRLTRADQVVAFVAGRGDRGATVAEVCRGLRVHHGIASGALSRVERQGRLRRKGVLRDGRGVRGVLSPNSASPRRDFSAGLVAALVPRPATFALKSWVSPRGAPFRAASGLQPSAMAGSPRCLTETASFSALNLPAQRELSD